MLLFLCASVVLYYFVKWWWRLQKHYKLASKLENPPGFQYHPIMGHAKHINNPRALLKLYKSFTSPCGVAYMGMEPFFFVNDANMVEQVLSSSQCLDKPYYFNNLRFIQNFILVARNEVWHKQRKILAPLFKTRMIHYYESISIHRELLLQELSSKSNMEINIFPIIHKYVFVHFFECTLGVDCSRWFEKYPSLSESLQNQGFQQMSSILPQFSNNERRDIKILHQYVNEIISERHYKITNKGNNQRPSEKSEPMILLDYLIDCIDHGKLSRQVVVEEVIGFLAAGPDTTIKSLCALVVCLGIYPEIQEKAYHEVYTVLQDKAFEPSDYSKLPYLQMVMKESMRLCNVVAVVPRVTKEDVKIGEYVFPKDSTLQLNTVNMHYNPKYFENPNEFIPERFAPEIEKTRPRYAYMPFSGGRRNCPGEFFAKQMIIGTISTLLQNYRFESKYKSLMEVQMVFKFLMTFEEGYNVMISSRK